MRPLPFLLVALTLAGPAQAADFAQVATPPGITLSGSGARLTYADTKGRALYTFDGDAAPDAAAWSAALAPARAKATGDWTLIKREEGAQQWAFRGKPLYASIKDGAINAKGQPIDKAWHMAAFDPAKGIVTPVGIKVGDIMGAGGLAFTNDQGQPLYVFSGDVRRDKTACTGATCPNRWLPLTAAQIARPVGDFTVVERDDGVAQWAYKGQSLYVFDGDTQPGEAFGSSVDPRWQAVVLYRYFMPPGVSIRRNHFDGYNLATDTGMTIYQRDRFRTVNGGHSLRLGSRGNDELGKLLGTAACDGACLETWRPLVAPASSQPTGMWDIAVRDDGTRQWVYRDYAVYTYTGDSKPGDMNGNDRYDLVGRYTGGNDAFFDGERDPKSPTGSTAGGRLPPMGAPAMFWHAVVP